MNSFVVGRLAVIQVTDNGIGIPASALPNVFDRFYRTDKARSRVSGGTGLGLAIVKAICHAHGGSVTLTSSEGAGTLVRIELPLAAGAPASPLPATSARPSPVEVAAD